MSATLATRASTGDIEAFGLIYQQHRLAVYRVVWNRVRNTELAEDITQETFARAFRSIGRWKWQGSDIGAWLNSIARNLTIDYHRSAYRRLSVAVADFTAVGVVLYDTAPEGDPERCVLDGMQQRDVLAAMRRISADQAACLTYRYLRQLSIAETAREMGRKEDAIKSLTHRALRSLRCAVEAS